MRRLLLALLGIAPLVLGAQRPTDAASSVRILRVPAPTGTRGSWSYTVEMASGTRVIGAASGTTAEDGRTPVLLTVQTSAQLEAGRRDIGRVIFRRGMETIEAPITVDVAARRALELHAAIPLRVATVGEDVELLFTLRNSGNAADSVALDLRAPAGWGAALSGPRAIVVPATTSVSVRVVVQLPTSLQSGGTVIQLRAAGLAGTAEAQSIVEVGATRAIGSGEALHLTSSLTQVGGNAAPVRSIAALEVTGAILPGVQLSAVAVSPVSMTDATILRGASTVGLPVTGSTLRLSGARGALQVGRVGLTLPELAGRSIGGEGLALSAVGRGTLSLAAVRDERGRLTQGALTWANAFGPVSLDAAAVRVRAPGFGLGTTRELSALSVGARVVAGAGTSVGLELADRRANGTDGLGAAADLAWVGDAGRAHLRVQHAAGGAAALATAQDAITGESMLQLGRQWSVTSHGWYTRDADRVAGGVTSFGGGIAPSRRIGETTDLALTLGTSGFSMARLGLTQGSMDTELGLRGTGLIGATRWELEGMQRMQDRSTAGATIRLTERSTRLAVRSGLSWSGRSGTVSLRGGFAEATTTQASELSFGVQAAELHPVRQLAWLSVEGAVARSYLGVSAMDNARIALRAALPGDFAVIAGLEREAWSGTQFLPARTAFALRVVRAATAATGDRWRSRTGIVFEDLDDDGVRDADEPVVPGVTLRSGTSVVATDRLGRFRLPVDADAPEIDVRSLRLDQRPGRRATGEKWAVPVRTVGKLEVAVLRPAGRIVSLTSNAPTTIVVTVKNRQGQEWRAVAAQDGVAKFDALPIGDYVVSAATVDAGTPLRIDDVAIVVARGSALPGAAAQRVELVPRDRPIKLQAGEGLGVSSLLSGSASGAGAAAGATTATGQTSQKQQQNQRQQQQQQRQQQQRQQQQ